MATNVDGRNFFHSKELNNGACLHSLPFKLAVSQSNG